VKLLLDDGAGVVSDHLGEHAVGGSVDVANHGGTDEPRLEDVALGRVAGYPEDGGVQEERPNRGVVVAPRALRHLVVVVHGRDEAPGPRHQLGDEREPVQEARAEVAHDPVVDLVADVRLVARAAPHGVVAAVQREDAHLGSHSDFDRH